MIRVREASVDILLGTPVMVHREGELLSSPLSELPEVTPFDGGEGYGVALCELPDEGHLCNGDLHLGVLDTLQQPLHQPLEEPYLEVVREVLGRIEVDLSLQGEGSFLLVIIGHCARLPYLRGR